MSMARKSKSPTVCNEEVERNGYWTGRFCGRPVKWLVGDKVVCGVHKNKILRVGWITEAIEIPTRKDP